MTIEKDPNAAPQRGDLNFLRRRTLRKRVQAKINYTRPDSPTRSAPPVSQSATTAPRISLERPPAPRPPQAPPVTPPPATAPAPAAPISLRRPAVAPAPVSLDLGRTPAVPPPAPQGTATGSPLDLRPTPGRTVEPSLDLGSSAPPAPPKAPKVQLPTLPPPPRAQSNFTTILDKEHPTVWLNRLQSGTGALHVRLRPSASADDTSLGCAYQFEDGTQGVIQVSGETLGTPPNPTRPLLWLSQRARGQGATLDLRQIRGLRRMIFYAYSPSNAASERDGVLSVETFGHAKVETQLRGPSCSVLVLMTAYVVSGEIVLRAEMEPFDSLRTATAGFGYRIVGL